MNCIESHSSTARQCRRLMQAIGGSRFAVPSLLPSRDWCDRLMRRMPGICAVSGSSGDIGGDRCSCVCCERQPPAHVGMVGTALSPTPQTTLSLPTTSSGPAIGSTGRNYRGAGPTRSIGSNPCECRRWRHGKDRPALFARWPSAAGPLLFSCSAVQPCSRRGALAASHRARLASRPCGPPEIKRKVSTVHRKHGEMPKHVKNAAARLSAKTDGCAHRA